MLETLKTLLKRFRSLPGESGPEDSLSQISYSLEGEDRVLMTLFNGAEDGFFVDVGAHHPFRYSNTAIFYKKGWRGVNIDAAPDSMGPFEQYRPEDLNLTIAIAQDSGVRNYYAYNDFALNGIDNDRREEFNEASDSPYSFKGIIEVEAAPLRQILLDNRFDFTRPNFLNIDVEGLEIEVLKSNDWSHFPFQFIVVEQRFEDFADILKSECCSFLRSVGYKPVANTGRTSFYCLARSSIEGII